MSRLVYLAGPSPLDGLEHDGTKWYDELDLPEDWLAFMPGRAYQGSSLQTAESVVRANRAMLSVADGVLVNLLGQGRALGTAREIDFAKGLGKPLVVAGDLEKSLAAYDLELTGSLKLAVHKLSASLRAW